MKIFDFSSSFELKNYLLALNADGFN